ncbi:hypothetical protein P3G55_25760 [Leptospira sp. 96542]|nr:hypothetical protein [Leptospira sp. 96542]
MSNTPFEATPPNVTSQALAAASNAGAHLSSRLMSSRQPAPVTRIGSPRVLDRVGGNAGVLRGSAPTASATPQAPLSSDAPRVEDVEDDLAHIPAFLKLVKA